MRSCPRILVVIALLALALPLVAQDAGPRCALVIGNGNYADLGKLKNPVNDAQDMAAALRQLGFKVTLVTDANRKAMNEALNDFHDELAQASSSDGFFWYAGHGVQSKGENYLIPVGADIRREADLEDEAVRVSKITGLLDDARNRVDIVVLDACRNNPLPSMGRSAARGLTVVSAAPPESVIMYSTGAGQVAQDGAGRNSPFAQAFLKYLGQSGDVTATIKAVTAETKRLTAGAQVPYLYSSLTLDFAFNQKAGASAPAIAAPTAPGTVTVTKGLGILVVDATSGGALYLDGAKVADLSDGDEATIPDVQVGQKSLELRHDDGKVEAQTATVSKGQATSVAFKYKPAPPKPAAQAAPATPAGFVLVPGGTFTMGSPAGEAGRFDNEVQHQVSLSSFEISKYDVTFDDFDAYCAATGASKPSDQGWGRGQRPVINVSWYEAVAYCNWRSKQEGLQPAYAISGTNVGWDRSANGYRLPTEAEWEYAAKGGPASVSLAVNAVYAGSADLAVVAWYSGNSGNQTHPVGQKAPNSLGLYDMAGNVWQWCWDWYATNNTGVSVNPTGPAFGDDRVLRGGSWSHDAQYLRSAIRCIDDPANRNNGYGFRLLCSQIGQ